jgi:hypothetical protein
MVFEQLGHYTEPIFRSHLQSCFSCLVLGVNIYSVVQEKLHDLNTAIVRSAHERRTALFCLDVDVRASLQDRFATSKRPLDEAHITSVAQGLGIPQLTLPQHSRLSQTEFSLSGKVNVVVRN